MSREAWSIMVIYPSPPTWMSASRIIWPSRLNWVQVSATTRPVTQVAEVAVNRLSRKDRPFPPRLAMGSISSRAPARMMARKPRASARLGASGRCFAFIKRPLLPNSFPRRGAGHRPYYKGFCRSLQGGRRAFPRAGGGGGEFFPGKARPPRLNPGGDAYTHLQVAISIRAVYNKLPNRKKPRFRVCHMG